MQRIAGSVQDAGNLYVFFMPYWRRNRYSGWAIPVTGVPMIAGIRGMPTRKGRLATPAVSSQGYRSGTSAGSNGER